MVRPTQIVAAPQQFYSAGGVNLLLQSVVLKPRIVHRLGIGLAPVGPVLANLFRRDLGPVAWGGSYRMLDMGFRERTYSEGG